MKYRRKTQTAEGRHKNIQTIIIWRISRTDDLFSCNSRDEIIFKSTVCIIFFLSNDLIKNQYTEVFLGSSNDFHYKIVCV